MNEAQALVSTMELGKEVIEFLNTPVGKYLMERQRQDEQDATKALLALDPYTYTDYGGLLAAILKAQEAVNLSRGVNAYLQDAILMGNDAEKILDNLGD